MKRLLRIETTSIVIVAAVIGVVRVAFPYIRRVYRRLKCPPQLGIIHLNPGDKISEAASDAGVALSCEPFE
jgi:hypothetical protein